LQIAMANVSGECGVFTCSARAHFRARSLSVFLLLFSKENLAFAFVFFVVDLISLNPREQRHWFADYMSIRQFPPFRVCEQKPLFFSAHFHLPVELIENSLRRSR
jgi:hypothetical protein